MLKSNIVEFPAHLARPVFNRDRFKEARQQACLTQTQLADLIHVSSETISNLESGQRQPGPETLLQICKELGFSPAYFSDSGEEGGNVESPIFFRSYASKIKRQNNCLDVWRKWAGRMMSYLGRYLNLPPVNLPSAVWNGEGESDNLMDRAEELAQQCRRLWGIGDGPIGNLTRLAESMGVCVVRLDLPNMEEVDGFACWQDGRPMIFLIAKESASRERLNLAHELLHLIAHRQLPADVLEDDDAMEGIEREAFAFAGALLLPRNTYGRELFSFKIPHFVEQKRRWGVSIGSQGKRCLDLGIMDIDQFTQFRKNLSWNKYIKREPLDDTLPHEFPLMMSQAIELLSKHGVASGWQIADKFGFNAEKMRILTNLNADLFRAPQESPTAIDINLRA